MSNFNNKIDRMVSKILNEEIEKKVKKFTKEINEGEWKEIEVDEALHGKQKKLDVAEPKGKLTAADFKKLRAKKETKEQIYFEDEFIDDEEESQAEELSQQEPTYVGRGLKDNKMGAEIKNKIFGSFTDTGDWYDEQDKEHTGEFDFDYDEEEFEDFEPFYEKFGEKTNWFAPGDEGKKFFDMYKERFGPMLVRTPRDLGEEAETEEGNAFTGALAKAKEEGDDSFEVDGKKFQVKESALSNFKEKVSAWAYDVDLDIIRKCKKETKGKGLGAFQDCLEKNGAKLSVIGTRPGDAAMGGNWKEFGGSISRTDYKPKVSKKETKEYFHYDDEDFDEYDMGEKYKLMSIPDGDYSGIGDIMRKRYNKDMDISDDEEEESIEEQETEEGNAFSGALAKAKEQGKDTFEVDGKKYNVKEARDKFDGRKSKVIGVYSNIDKQRKEMGEKWEGDVDVKQTGQYSDKTIAQLNAHIKKLKAKNEKTKEGGKKVSDADKTKMSQLYFAKRAKQGWKGKGKAAVKESLQLTEDELIDMIEKIVLEQKVKDRAEKNNITTKKAEGLKKTEKVLKADKKENEDYAKLVVKKMKEYLKPGSVGEFNESPENFPQSNYTQGKMKEKTMKYHPSQAVDEYIEAFAYPGQTNLVFDEIKPDDKKIEKYLKGDKTTGNAVKDENGKALGNVVPSEVGERFMKNYEDNLYGAEQMNVSYKRQPQPVDVGGTDKMTGSLKSIRKGSTAKAGKILNQLESTDEKGQNLIKEDLNKIFKLMKYNEKTQ